MWNFRLNGLVSHRAPLTLILLSTLSFSAFTTLIPEDAAAQSADRGGMINRLDRLERDLQILQKDYYRGEKSGGASVAPTAAAAAEMNVSLDALQEELRSLRGRLEEMEHQQRRVTERFDGLERDMDARLISLEQHASSAAPAVIAPPVIGGGAAPEEPVVSVREAAEEAPAEAPKSTRSKYTNSNDHYNAAFKLLNQSDYAAAASEFESFTREYPKDVLVGNAYYWLGETYYVRGNYAQAAEKFRSGFEAMPQGAKAPDNLLKLAMSLSNIDRKDESCVVLSQLVKKYGDKSQMVKNKAQKEREKLSCE